MAVSYGTYTITEVQEGSQIWTTTVAPSSPNYTFTISNLTGDSETSIKVGDIIMYSYYRYTVLSISNDGTTVLTGNRVSIRGATGAASVTYTLIVSNLAIIKDKDGNLSPSSITVTAKSQTGSDAMENYTGRIQIETTTDNSTWTSRVNEDASTKIYTIPTDTTAVRCSLYLNGGTTTLLDQQTIPVVSDGVDGTNGINGKDAYTVILTNDNHTFAGDSTHATASEVDCSVIAYKGATQVAATIGSISGQPTGMTTSITDNSTTNAYFTVSVTTSMTAKNGTLTIPITVDGKTFTKKFTYSLALDGVSVVNVTSTNDTTDGGTSIITVTMSDGSTKTFNVKNGSKGSTGDTAEWFYGTELTHKSGTATATISGAVIGSMYLNTETSLVYKCTDISNGTMTWTYAGDLTTGIINNVDIVGDNLFISLPYISSSYVTGSNNVSYAYDRATGTYVLTATQTNTGSFGQFYTLHGVTNLEAILGKEVTLSAESISCSNSNAAPRVFFYAQKSDNSVYSYFVGSGGSLKKTFTVPADTVLAGYIIRGDQNTNLVIGDVATFKGVKLELGNKATRWIPSVDDVIGEGGKTATNFLSVDSTGIMVANMSDGEERTPSNATGNNVFINNTSVNIRNDKTVLSSFKKNSITLGESGKTRLELTNSLLRGVSDNGVVNFKIVGQDVSSPGTISDSGKFANQMSSSSSSTLFSGYFSPNISIANAISATVRVKFTENGNTSEYSYSYTAPTTDDPDVAWVVIPPEGATVTSDYTIKYKLTINRDGYNFKIWLTSGTAPTIGKNATYIVTAKVSDYHDSSFTFGSRYGQTIGANSCTIGEKLTATSMNQVAIGRYNYDNTKDDSDYRYAFMVGNGIKGATSNALSVDWNGNVIAGSFTANKGGVNTNYLNCSGDISVSGDIKVDGNSILKPLGGNYLSTRTNINNLGKEDTGWWVYNRNNVSGTFPISDTYGTIGHIQGTSDNVGMQFLRSNSQASSNNTLYARFKLGGTWGSWQKFVSATTTSLTITRVANDYFNATDATYPSAYKKGGFLTFRGNFHLSASVPNNTADVKVATISGWNAATSAIMCVPAQNGNATLLVNISSSGDLTISNYSGVATNSQAWFRFMVTVPCADGYE